MTTCSQAADEGPENIDALVSSVVGGPNQIQTWKPEETRFFLWFNATLWEFNIANRKIAIDSGFFPLKMVIFHSYV